MREILFRGFHECKNGKHKVFVNGEWIKGEWVNGYYSALKAPSTGEIKHVIFSFDRVVDYVIPETVGEYSGENNRNGKQIFEGDILKVKRHLYKVVWTHGCLYAAQCNYLKGNVTRYCLVDGLCEQGAEVIGNIYETPELLEVEQ